MALYLNEGEIEDLLDMPATIEAVEMVMAAHARGDAVDFPRQRVRLDASMTHMLQGGVPYLNLSGFKVYTTSGGRARFWVHLFNATNGDPVAVLEADRLGMMRTGAAGAVAARKLARSDSRVVGVFGAGWQAEGQITALASVFGLAKIKVFSRDRVRLLSFCERMCATMGCEVVPAERAEETVRGSDIVVTITTSPKPLFDAEWLEPGTHINAAGSNSLVRQELSESILRKVAVVCVDARETALREAGDLLPMLEKGRTRPGQWVELGEVLNGSRAGRTHNEQITLFESQGMAIQDIAVASVVVGRAREQSRGIELPY